MSAVVIRTEDAGSGEIRFRAIAGTRERVGRTMGEALDALTADWGDDVQETAVLIQRFKPDRYFTEAQYRRMQELLARRTTLSGAFECICGQSRCHPIEVQELRQALYRVVDIFVRGIAPRADKPRRRPRCPTST